MSEKELTSTDSDQISRLVMLIYGIMSNANPFWCFVAVKPTRYKELQTLVAEKNFDIRNYEADGFGEIVVSGEGVTPPTNVVETVAKMFDVPVRKLFDESETETKISEGIEKREKDAE